MIDCTAEEFVPITVADKSTYAQVRQKAAAACNAAKLLQSEGYDGEDSDPDDYQFDLKELVSNIAIGKEVPTSKMDALIETPAGAVAVNNLLSAFDMEVVQDAKRIRNYVTNKLILESENMDARIRMKALEMLGKISDVGLFSEKTEITVNNRSMVELENSLREKLRRILGTDTAEDAQIIAQPVAPTTQISVDDALGDL